MPLSVIYGNEQFLLNQAVQRLQQKVVDPAFKELSHVVLETPKLDAVIEAVSAVRFNLGGQTLIEIQQFDLLHKSPGNSVEEKQLEQLKELLLDHDATKHILFVSEKMNRRLRFPKWLTSKDSMASVQEYKVLNFWQTGDAVDILLQYAREEEIKLTPQAGHLLVEYMGVEIQPLISEIQKLNVFTGNQSIEPAHVMAMSNHNDNTFGMLNDWINNKNRPQVFNTLQEILLTQHPIQLFALTQSYINNIFQLKLLQKTGQTPADIAAATKKNSFKIKKDLELFRNVPFERLEALKSKTLDLEWKMKTGELSGHLALEVLLGA